MFEYTNCNNAKVLFEIITNCKIIQGGRTISILYCNSIIIILFYSSLYALTRQTIFLEKLPLETINNNDVKVMDKKNRMIMIEKRRNSELCDELKQKKSFYTNQHKKNVMDDLKSAEILSYL